MSRGLGVNQRKALLLLQAGVALGLSGSPKRYFSILKVAKKEWDWINSGHLKRTIYSLYKSKLVSEKQNKDGTTTLVLTKEGKKRALTFDMGNLKIEPSKKWDGYWRIVIYDIPEIYKISRDSLREHLRDIGFVELQHSVWVYPHECFDQIEFLVEFYSLNKYVRLIVADFIDNENYLKRRFKINC